MAIINQIYKSIETEMSAGLKRISFSPTLFRDFAFETEGWNILSEQLVKTELKVQMLK